MEAEGEGIIYKDFRQKKPLRLSVSPQEVTDARLPWASSIRKVEIPGVQIITPRENRDTRGFFAQVMTDSAFNGYGMKQINLAGRVVGTVAGFHGEPEAKACLVTGGRALIFWVDVRPESSVFGKVCTMLADARYPRVYFLPPGVAHGIMPIDNPGGPFELIYAISEEYSSSLVDNSVMVRVDDPDINHQVSIPRILKQLGRVMVATPKDLGKAEGKSGNGRLLREIFPNVDFRIYRWLNNGTQ
jgi:dTDP-4-dehydrorhamnose 3,5-epimerase-like enzyme